MGDEELKKTNEEHVETTTALNTKVTDLQNDLDVAKNNHELLAKRVKDASDSIETKQTQLEGLECEKRESSQQLEMTQKQSNADRVSFQLQVETLNAKLAQEQETVSTLFAEKTQVEEQNITLSDNAEAMKVDRDTLQQRLNSAEDQVASFKLVVNEKEKLEEKLRVAEAKHQEMVATIGTLSEKNSNFEEELTNVSQKLVENDTQLQNELDDMREEFSSKEKQLRSENEATKNYAADQQEESKTKISEVQSTKDAILADSKVITNELENNRSKMNELERLVEHLRGENNATELLKTELDLMKKERASVEKETKAKIETLERENALFHKKSSGKPLASSLSHTLSQWQQSPIKPVDEPVQDTVFGADES